MAVNSWHCRGAKLHISSAIGAFIIAVCIYRLVMRSIDLSETAHFAHWKSGTTSKTIFFLTKKIFFSDFFLRLNFVSDYIPQLYFVCNHLIFHKPQPSPKSCRPSTFTVSHIIFQTSSQMPNLLRRKVADQISKVADHLVDDRRWLSVVARDPEDSNILVSGTV